MSEAIGIGDRIGQDDAMCSFVEGFGDVSEPFLTCSIPDVESDWRPLDLNPFDFKVDSDRAQVISLKSILAVSHQNASFSDSTIPDDQVLERYVLLCHYYLQQVR